MNNTKNLILRNNNGLENNNGSKKYKTIQERKNRKRIIEGQRDWGDKQLKNGLIL